MPPIIGRSTEGRDVRINVERLIETRAIVTSRSGGGKSWALRRLLEQTHGQVQQIVIDVEAEFFCVVPETPVLLSDGEIIPAGDLRTGHSVVSFDEQRGMYVSCQVSAVSRQLVPETWTLTAGLSRALTGTASHLLLVRDNKGTRRFGWKPLHTIKAGNYIAIPSHLPSPELCQWKWYPPKWMTQTGSVLKYRSPGQVSPYESRITLPAFDDPRLFRFLGYLLSDGHITKDFHSVHFVDGLRSTRDAFCTLASELFGASSKTIDHARKFEVWIRNTTLVKFLVGIGCQSGRKAHRLELPSLVMQSPIDLARVFLFAFRECDGFKKSLFTSSRKAATQLAYLIERTEGGEHASIYRKVHKTAYIKNAVGFTVHQVAESNQAQFSTKHALGAKERQSGKDGRFLGVHWVKVKSNKRLRKRTEVVGCFVPPLNNLVMGATPLISHNTLREKFDYVLAGGTDGDCPADTRSASMLARKLLELRVSAIIDIYELKAHDRIRFVRLFLESMIDAPKSLWHPCLIVIDEAQIFAPESTKCESAQAVIDLMTRGRKRGFAGVLATQRPASLSKDASAQAINKLIGGFSQDIDVERAAKDLGFFKRESRTELQTLSPGTFFAVGPALCETVTELRVGPVVTTHPRAGQRAMAPPPPREAVKKVLASLADLPAEAEKELQTVDELRARVRTLETEVRKAKPEAELRAMEQRHAEEMRRVRTAAKRACEMLAGVPQAIEATREFIAPIAGDETPTVVNVTVDATPDTNPAKQRFMRSLNAQPNGHKREPRADTSADARILRALAMLGKPATKRQLGVLSGVNPKKSTWRASMASLKQQGLVNVSGHSAWLTDAGMNASKHLPPITPDERVAMWKEKFDASANRMFDALIARRGVWPLPRHELALVSGIDPKLSTWRAAMAQLRASGFLIEDSRGFSLDRDLLEG